MKVFLVSDTNIWHGDPRLIGVASSIEAGVQMAQEDKDAVTNVVNNDGHVIIEEITVDVADSEHRVFDTDFDENWEELTGKPRYEDD